MKLNLENSTEHVSEKEYKKYQRQKQAGEKRALEFCHCSFDVQKPYVSNIFHRLVGIEKCATCGKFIGQR